MSRRFGRRDGNGDRASGGDAATPTLLGVGGIDNDTSMVTAAPGGVAGVDTGFFIAMLIRPLRAESGTAWVQRRVIGTQGYIARQLAATTLVFSCANGVGTFINSPAYTITPDIGKVTGLVLGHDGSNLRMYAQRVEVGSGTPITGYTPAPAVAMLFGGAGGVIPQYDFFGAVGGPGVPSLANIQAWFDGCKAAYACVQMPSVPGSNMWNARSPLAAPLDSVGSNNLSFGGSGHTLISETAPTWGW